MLISDWSSDMFSSDLSGRLGSAIAGDAAKLDQRPGFAQDIVPQFVAQRIFQLILGLEPFGDRHLQRRLPALRQAHQPLAPVLALPERKRTRLNPSTYCAYRMPPSD